MHFNERTTTLEEVVGSQTRAPMASTHRLVCGDARDLSFVADESVALVLTSPPYWTLKQYPACDGQLGAIAGYREFLSELRRVWEHAYRVLIPGGRLAVVAGDVMVQSRNKAGEFFNEFMPLHSEVQLECQSIGFRNQPPILWYKIPTTGTEARRDGLPYEPNDVIANNVEYVVMCRKPGVYRSCTVEQRRRSALTSDEHAAWFRQLWTDVPRARQADHPAAFPEPLAYRLVRMFSFHGDTVLDPFSGSGTTALAAMHAGRSSVGVEIDPGYHRASVQRALRSEWLPSIAGADEPANPTEVTLLVRTLASFLGGGQRFGPAAGADNDGFRKPLPIDAKTRKTKARGPYAGRPKKQARRD
jgi:DNA modification methylase